MLHSLHKLLSIIKNGQRNRLLLVSCEKSKYAIAVLNIFQEHGFINGYRFRRTTHSFSDRIVPDQSGLYHDNEENEVGARRIEILLKYNNQKPMITDCYLISKSSRRNRIYKKKPGKKNLPDNLHMSEQKDKKG